MLRWPAAGSRRGVASQRQGAASGGRDYFYQRRDQINFLSKNSYLTSGLSSAERPLACNHTLCAHVQKGKNLLRGLLFRVEGVIYYFSVQLGRLL